MPTCLLPTSVALLLGALAVAYLASRERRRRTESELVVRMMRKVRLEAGLAGTLDVLADEMLRIFAASRVLIAARETGGGRAFLWRAHRAAPNAARPTLQRSALGLSDRESYFFAGPPSWHAVRRPSRGKRRFDVTAVDEHGRRLHHVSSDFIPDRFAEADACRSFLAISFEFGAEWTGRLFVLDAGSRFRAVGKLRFVRKLVGELGPAIHNLHLLHRLQTKAAAVERGHLARALHDGLVQSLIGAGMRVHVARRQAAEKLPLVDAELSHIEEILHQEVLSVRDLMQRIKPIQIDPGELLDFLSEQVEKFERDTGVSARFFFDVRQVALPSQTCTQVARIVQEALCNVRKHSGARTVEVRLVEDAGRWSLIVEDDGRGLRGLLPTGGSADSADRRRTLPRTPSPAVIKECVHSLGGQLALQPAASGGLRLEVTFPGYSAGRAAPFGPVEDVRFEKRPTASGQPKSARPALVSKTALRVARSPGRGFVSHAPHTADRR